MSQWAGNLSDMDDDDWEDYQDYLIKQQSNFLSQNTFEDHEISGNNTNSGS